MTTNTASHLEAANAGVEGGRGQAGLRLGLEEQADRVSSGGLDLRAECLSLVGCVERTDRHHQGRAGRLRARGAVGGKA